ncbi:zinc finger protein 135 [Drosophila willistoni]|nr:zinc finger protein 135 [Drosophila willistoni]
METEYIETEEMEEVHEDSEPPLWELVEEEEVPGTFDLCEEELSESERYFCYDCHRIFENRVSAEEHICPQAGQTETETAEPPVEVTPAPAVVARNMQVTCHICNTIFGSSKALKFHMRMHGKVSTKSIQDALPVGAHQQYNQLDQFYCEICNKSFDESLLAVHKQMHQESSLEQLMCRTCNRKFDNVNEYEMHLKMHEKQTDKPTSRPVPSNGKKIRSDKPGYPCQYCERVFLRPYEKVKHERVHTGEKPYACEVCGKTFRVTYSLTLHLRTHTNIRPYVCTVCNKRFKSHQVYSHHLRIHSSEKEYACDKCPKTFRTSVQLSGHKNTHTKPFECTICNRPFASLYAVKAHMVNHKDKAQEGQGASKKPSTNGKFWCTVCGAEYSRIFAYRQHLKTAHGQSEDNGEKKPRQLLEEEGGIDDTEAAALRAAADADAAYMLSDVTVVDTIPTLEEFDVENLHTEEIITDWLT